MMCSIDASFDFESSLFVFHLDPENMKDTFHVLGTTVQVKLRYSTGTVPPTHVSHMCLSIQSKTFFFNLKVFPFTHPVYPSSPIHPVGSTSTFS
jgi:hypothetical protein